MVSFLPGIFVIPNSRHQKQENNDTLPSDDKMNRQPRMDFGTRMRLYKKFMMKSILLCLLLIILLSSGCTGVSAYKKKQADSIAYVNEATLFIKQVKKDQLNITFILEDAPVSFLNMGCLPQLINDTINFTPGEIKVIEQRIKSPIIKQWTASILSNIHIISADTISAIFKTGNKGWEYFHEHFGGAINSFSEPIFFRNNTYCLFYSDYSCGFLCAEGHAVLYRKDNNKWVEVRSYCGWVS